MTTFVYKARDLRGKSIRGVIEADSEVNAAAYIERLSLSPVAISSQSELDGFIASFERRFQRISHQEVLVFTRQLSTLISTGVPLIQTLENVGQQTGNPRFKEVVVGLIDSIKSGASFSAALSRYPLIFSNLYISMIRVGETAGLLDKVLKRLADLSTQDIDLRSRLRAALIYPCVLAIVAFLIVNFVMIGVLPKFVAIFEASEAKLPWPTVMLLAVSDFLRAYWWVLGLGLTFLSMTLRSYYRTPEGKFKIDGMVLNLPMAGPLVLKVLVCRFSRSIAALTRSGVPVLEALTVIESTIENSVLQRIIANVREAVSGGQSLTEPFEASGLFPPMVIQLINTGERSGKLGEMFDQIADFYEPEVEFTVRNLTSILEPVMLLVMGVIVSFISLSVLLPIFNLIKIIRR